MEKVLEADCRRAPPSRPLQRLSYCAQMEMVQPGHVPEHDIEVRPIGQCAVQCREHNQVLQDGVGLAAGDDVEDAGGR